MILPGGCVQPSLAPDIDIATARVLDQLGIQLVQTGGCCGAVSHHLSATEQAKDYARRNIDAWWPHIEAGAEAIVSNTSGCGVMLKDYAHLLSDDPLYADKAERIAHLSRDIVEVLEAEDITSLKPVVKGKRIGFHSPCTLQHGQSLAGRVEALLRRAGYELLSVPDAHLCCGSAGTYSITQPQLSRQLRDNKLAALNQASPDLIATANIGCLLHLAAASEVSVKHWITLFDSGIENG
jgi:glycolate oxidase iron-sulfur subunit